jgi:peptidoglycan L-alanyl-D-glutamate endopeptidase CwlK
MARNISDLHPRLQELIPILKKKCSDNGLMIGIGECLRTVAEQDALYAQGRTAPGNIVTNVSGSAYSSQHQWGVAFDFYRDDGTGAYNEAGQFFEKVGLYAKSIGLGWGGDWTSIVDRPHLYLSDWGSTPTPLKREYGTPANFMATWNRNINAAENSPDKKPATPSQKPNTPPQKLSTATANLIIRNIQSWCNNYSKTGLILDGIYGSKTKKGLCKSLQHFHNINYDAKLVEDGIFGNSTKAACRVAGDKSDLTYIAQAMLYCLGYDMSHSLKGINLDSTMGVGTVNVVKMFQQKYGLAQDGKCGKNTFYYMFR